VPHFGAPMMKKFAEHGSGMAADCSDAGPIFPRVSVAPSHTNAARALKSGIKNAIGFRGVKETEILAGPARGVRMTLDFSGETPMYLGMYEWELHRFFREVLPSAELVFDVGGSVGYDALLFAANCRGRVISFEPDPAELERLRANVGLNPSMNDRITVKAQAIGRENGHGAITLDSLSAEVGAPDFVKIDVDGGELDVLAGGERTLRDGRPDLVVETHSRELEERCGAFLVDCGYRPIIKHNRKVWREHRAGAAHNRWLLARGRSAAG
jgi:hypothetical protein